MTSGSMYVTEHEVHAFYHSRAADLRISAGSILVYVAVSDYATMDLIHEEKILDRPYNIFLFNDSLVELHQMYCSGLVEVRS